jgi:cytochrome c oxidase accessory protein FixG
MEEKNFYQDESFRDSLTTVDKEGKRIWIFPKRSFGPLTNYRSYLSYLLLIFLFAGPWIRIGGEPLLLINIIERKFVLLGRIFWPQDFYLFGLAMITGVVFIILFTVVYGRIFCGWICPQTIFMEHVFRKIEYWIEGDWKHQKKLADSPWTPEKIRKRLLKHSIFFLIAFAISNTFLAYIIGSEQLLAIQFGNPLNHLVGLGAMLAFTVAFYFVFARLREQVCTNICPYGRLQGVMLDKSSIVVAYDYVRGENRGKWRNNEDRKTTGKGDCIDCHQCVDVCPTGIDIRNGTQLECINCTACIDACNHIMESVDLKKGLIRYASDNGIKSRDMSFKWNIRNIAYTAVLLVLVGIMTALLVTRKDVSATVLRTPGVLFQKQEDGRISNLYNFKLLNKTNRDMELEFRILNADGEVKMVGTDMHIEGQGLAQGSMFIIFDKSELAEKKKMVKIGVFADGKQIATTKTNFVSP